MGREHELAALVEALAGAEAGRGALVVLSGEAGIGKTWLAEALADRALARGAFVAWGAAWDGGGAPAYWPWIQLLRALRPLIPAPDAGLRRALGPLWDEPEDDPPRRLDPELLRFRRLDALRAVLAAAAARQPLALILEDLHAADRESLLALQLVARETRRSRLLLLATAREAEAAEPGGLLGRAVREATVLTLPRFGRPEVARLVSALEPVTPAMVDDVLERSGGNPLFAAELLRALRSGASPREVPARLGALIAERLARFEPAAREALEALAVLGREAPWALLADLCGGTEAEARERLRLPRLAGVVEGGTADGPRFVHALFREQLQDGLPAPRRASLHLAAAAALARRGTLGRGGVEEAVAGHRLAALPAGDPAEAVAWAERAAAAASQALAFDRAAAFLEGAISALEAARGEPGHRIDLELALAEVLVRLGQGGRARALCLSAAAAARALPDAARLGHAALAYGGELRVAVVDPALVASLEEALAAPGTGDPGLRARLLARLGAAMQPADDPRVPLAHARAGVALARTLDDPATLLAALDNACSGLGAYAPPAERRSLSREQVSLAVSRGDLILAQRGYARLAVDAAELGDLEESAFAVEAHARLGAALGHPRWRWRGALLRSMHALARGRWEEAARAQADAAGWLAQGEDPHAALTLAIHRLGALRARGLEGADAVAAVVRDAPPALSAQPLMAALSRASTLARLGERDGARRVLDGAAIPEALALPLSLTMLADAVVHSGDRGRAAALLPRLQALQASWPAMSWGASGFIWDGPVAQWTAGLLALLERWDEAIAALEGALGDAEAAGARPVSAEVRCALGAALARRGGAGDPARAAGLLEAAHADAAALRMPHLAARIGEARALGGPSLRSAAPAPARSFALSREGEVWAISSGARTVRLRHSRALELLDRLVREPGREFHVLDLGAAEGGAPIDLGSAGEAIDPAARDAYRLRLRELEAELGEAEGWNDAARAERLRAEAELLREELARGLGLGGRGRRAPSSVERARVNVQKRLRGAIRRIGAELPELARHLDASIRTGTVVCYRPRG